MVAVLVALLAKWRVALLELVGAGCVVWGVALVYVPAAVVVVGVFLLAKSVEADLRRDGGP